MYVTEPASQEVHSWRVTRIVAFVAFQALLIGGFLAQRSNRRRVERAARISEAALRSSNAEIRELAGQLIFAQEVERTRIARDLHDDACQEVAAITVDIGNLRHKTSELQDTDVQRSLLTLQRRLAGVAESLRLLSHDLHPSLLKHAGLAAALEAHCADVERQHHIRVKLYLKGEVEPRSPVVVLSLFRIAQEALRNAARHGRAQQVVVTLARQGDQVVLSVADDGSGFDPGRARENGGLGLVSIEERTRLVKGQVTIRSEPRQGTTIDVSVPFDTDDIPDAHLPAACL